MLDFFLSPFFGAFIQQLYIIYYSRWLIFIYSMLLAKQHINWCSWMTYSDILIIHGYFFSLFSFSLSRLWIRICRNSISNSTQIQCQKISNYTRLSTCWFRQLVPWAVNWFIASSKETSWKNLLLILIQVCKNFSLFLFSPFYLSIDPLPLPRLALPFLHFRHYVISFFSYPVNGRCCLNHFSSHSFVCLKMMAHNSPKRQEENSNNPTITLLPTIVPVQLNIVDAIFTSHSSFSTSWWFVTLIFLLADFFSLSIVWYFDMRQKRFHSRLPSL